MTSGALRGIPIPQAVVLHAPGFGGGGDLDVLVRDLDPYWPLRLREWRLCQRLWYDVTGWYWVLADGDSAVAVDTLLDPDGHGKYAFVGLASNPGEGIAPAGVRAAYL